MASKSSDEESEFSKSPSLLRASSLALENLMIAINLNGLYFLDNVRKNKVALRIALEDIVSI